MPYPKITSRQNPLVKAAAQLAASAQARREQGLFLCEGARLCEDCARSGVWIETCFFTQEAGQKYAGYLAAVLKAAREAYQVEGHVAQLLSTTKSPQGIFCVCKSPAAHALGCTLGGPVLVLENLQDPGNLGTILRTAEALGVGQVSLLGDCCDPYSPKVLRASMGAVFRLSLAAEASAGQLVQALRGQGYRLHGAVPDRAAHPVTEMDFTKGAHALFIGNEGTGLTKETIALCDGLVTIPMAGRAESLNAAAAATILLWELQRSGKKEGGMDSG